MNEDPNYEKNKRAILFKEILKLKLKKRKNIPSTLLKERSNGEEIVELEEIWSLCKKINNQNYLDELYKMIKKGIEEGKNLKTIEMKYKELFDSKKWKKIQSGKKYSKQKLEIEEYERINLEKTKEALIFITGKFYFNPFL